MVEITHALVRFIRPSKKVVIPINSIKEFEKNKPKHRNDFKKKTLYSAKATVESRSYRAIEIFFIGTQAESEEENNTSRARHRSTKFNISDINEKSFDESDSEHANEDDADGTPIEEDASDPEDNLQPYSQSHVPSKSVRDRANLFVTQRATVQNSANAMVEKLKMELDIVYEKNQILSNKINRLTSEKQLLNEKVFEAEEENETLKMEICNLKRKNNVNEDQSDLDLDEENTPESCNQSTPKKRRPYMRIPVVTASNAGTLNDLEKLNMNKNRFKYPEPNTVQLNELNNKLYPRRLLEPFEENGVKKLHIGFGLVIDRDVYDNITYQSKTCSVACKDIARNLWPGRKLAERFVERRPIMRDGTRQKTERKVVTPQKMYAIRVALFDIMKKKPRIVKRKSTESAELGKITHYISEEISETIRNLDQVNDEGIPTNPVVQLVHEIVLGL